MTEEIRKFNFPILLVPSSVIPSTSDTPAEKYRYLSHVYAELSPSHGRVSYLEDVVLDRVRTHKHFRGLDVPPNFVLQVEMYELIEQLWPSVATVANMKNAYEIIDNLYLDNKAILLQPQQPLTDVQSEEVVAVLNASTSLSIPVIIHGAFPSCRARCLLDFATVHVASSRENIAAAARMRKRPSTGATVASCMNTQQDSCLDAVYNSRPLTLTPPPITIYHPVYAKFLRLMAEPQDFTHAELDRAQKFVTKASAYYRSNTDRARRSLLEMGAAVHPEFLMESVLSYASGRLEPGGVVFSAKASNGFRSVAMITEAKVEVGEGGCDPIAQAECTYVAVYSSDEAWPARETCCCPAFIIGMAGPNIIVSGAVFADQLIAQTLTDYISVVPRPTLTGRSPIDDAGRRVARLFRALRGCIKDLDEYYSQLVQAMSPASKPPSMIGPHFKTYHNSADEEVELTYTERLDPDLSMKAVSVAEAKSKSETAKVVVKFAYTYNGEAHELLANASPPQAPKLRYCEYESDVGMWVVVMDYVEGREDPTGDLLTEPVHVDSLRVAVTMLHEHGLVFGDLRAPNILLVDDRAVLIDFDWCGKAGEARYPGDILLDNISWHSEVRRGGLIDRAHDVYLFRLLTQQEL